MDTASFQFVLFGLATAVISNLHRSSNWRLAVLLVSSAVFIAMLTPDARALLPLTAFLLFGYVSLLIINGGWTSLRACLVVAVILTYVWLKKYTFLPHDIFIDHPYLTLGLSYIFFRVLHLIIEAGGKGPRVGFLQYLAYTLNFTTFVSGPIQRFDDFAKDQFTDKPIGVSLDTAATQIERLIRGFFKVNVLALVLNMLLSDAVTQLTLPVDVGSKLSSAFEVAILYPFFLYANFSGYIDIVIAIARLLNIRLPENFDRPFSSASFIEFWSRWHITLSNWLKTYVYNPLIILLMRRISSRALEPFLGVFCFFVTFFLVGVWHGRTSEFVVFGALQGGGVAINKLWQVVLSQSLGVKEYRSLAGTRLYRDFARGLTFIWFSFTLFWFWSDWGQIHELFAALTPATWLAVWAGVWIGATIVLSAWEGTRDWMIANRTMSEILGSSYARVVFTTTISLLIFAVTTLMGQPAPDIVYKAF